MCRVALLIGGLLVSAQPVLAQGVGAAVHAGTLGLGADLSVSGRRVGLRVGGNIFPFDVDLEASDVKYTVDLPSPQFTTLIDLYLVGGLRATGGLLFSAEDIDLVGQLTNSVEIGGGVYTPADVGTLSGSIVNKDVNPYLGLGFGNPSTSRLGFFLDLGVAFQGKPAVTLLASGPIASLPQFQADLEQERQSAEEDLEIFQYYPVLSIGVSVRLSGR